MNSKELSAGTLALSDYNKVVKDAYNKIWKQVKQLLATIERHELRCTLQREDRTAIGIGTKVHEVVSPIIYLCLGYRDSERLTIHFGFELLNDKCEFSHITSRFVRLLYTFTAKENTGINIESSINTDYVIYDCSALYETIEERMRHHTFKLIPYKPSASRRKQMQAVA